jgi:aminoglycoside phosphotransferase
MLLINDALAEAVDGYEWREILTGYSTAQVFRLERANSASLYLKIENQTEHSELREEKLRLEWLCGRLPVPEVRLFCSDETRDYLLTSEIEGVAASDDLCRDEPKETIIEQLARGLKAIHALPIADCPFDMTLNVKIEFARRNVELKVVDESDFDEARKGRSAEDLFRELVETKPKDEEDLVFTHGDFCLPNIILKNRRISGFIDLGRAGIADRYQDIALLARSVKYNFGEEWQPFLFETLDIEPDYKKLEFYTLLDEFF